MDKDLLSKLTCALMHDIRVCDKCRKCGKSGAEARIELVTELSKMVEKEGSISNEEGRMEG